MHFIFLIAFILFVNVGLAAEKPVIDLAQFDNADITGSIQSTIRNITDENPESFDFSPVQNGDLKLGYVNQALWLKAVIKNPSEQVLIRNLTFTSALTGKLILDQKSVDEDGHNEKTHLITGSDIPMMTENRRNRLSTFELKFPPHSTSEIYIKRVAVHNLVTRLKLQTPEKFDSDCDTEAYFLFFYLGGILCLVVYNLFICLMVRDLNYLLYTIFATSVLMASLSAQAFLDQFFPSIFGGSISFRIMIFSAMAQISSLVFSYKFLNVKNYIPGSTKLFLSLGALGLVSLVAGFFPHYDGNQVVFGNLIDFNIAATILFNLYCGFRCYQKGNTLALFYLLSWFGLFAGVFIWFAMKAGLIGYSAAAAHGIVFGNVGEMLIISFGLAYKFNIIDKEKNDALIKAEEKDRYHRLVKVLSHDVANSLTVFYSYSYKLQRLIKGNEEASAVLRRIEKIASNLSDLLGFVRFEESFKTNQLSAQLIPVDVAEATSSAAQFYEEIAAKKRIRFQLALTSDLFILGDHTALTNQVVGNILSNAVKFSPIDSEVFISVVKTNGEIQIHIKDSGTGMEPSKVRDLLSGQGTISKLGTDREKGSGIGLSLASDYVRIFGGRIEISSVTALQNGETGTTVSIAFPELKEA